MRILSILEFLGIRILINSFPEVRATLVTLVSATCVQGSSWGPTTFITIPNWCYTCQCLANNLSLCKAHIPIGNQPATVFCRNALGPTGSTVPPITTILPQTTLRPVTTIPPVPTIPPVTLIPPGSLPPIPPVATTVAPIPIITVPPPPATTIPPIIIITPPPVVTPPPGGTTIVTPAPIGR